MCAKTPDGYSGKVRRITNPAEISCIMERLGHKGFKYDPSPKICSTPCNGNSIIITVSTPNGKEKIRISDHYLSRVLERLGQDGTGCTPRQMRALDSFRKRLTERGASSFSESQINYLSIILAKVGALRGPSEIGEMRKEHIAKLVETIKNQTKAEVRDILKPYGLDHKADLFLYSFALAVIRNRGRGLPDSDDELDDSDIGSAGIIRKVCCLPALLKKELEGVPKTQTATVHDKFQYLLDCLGNHQVSVNAWSGGAPGSGKGGVR